MSSSWDAYADMLLERGFDGAAVLGHDGVIWCGPLALARSACALTRTICARRSQRGDLSLKPAEAAALAARTAPDAPPDDGSAAFIGGKYHISVRLERGVAWHLESGMGAVLVARTGSALLVGRCVAVGHRGVVNAAIRKLADYLVEQGS